jgi:hypothetical protein
VKVSGKDDLKELSFNVRLDSARSCGEMILRVAEERSFDTRPTKEWSVKQILIKQAELYETSLTRTFSIQEIEGLALYREAEMLVGGNDLTCEKDIRGLFGRFKSGVSKVGHVAIESLPEFDDEQVNDYLLSHFGWNGLFFSKHTKTKVELTFNFNHDKKRRHIVRLSKRGDYCVFEGMVANARDVRRLSKERLLELTWNRNRNIDLVGFLVRPDGCLIARAMHPLDSLDLEEFIFSAYILSVESDRLEYLIKEPDEF